MISTRDLSELPEIETLIKLNQALATLDAILCPEWEFRYFSFNNAWDQGEKLGLMRNGEGDDWLILFTERGALLKGFAHLAPMATGAPWPELFTGIPNEFAHVLDEPYFSRKASTFCLWRLVGAASWQQSPHMPPTGDNPDGSAELLRFFDGKPLTYKAWADEYFGHEIQLGAIERIYRHVPLNPTLVQALNPEVDYRDVRAEVGDIGYPISG
jgi:hypothetical protein